MEDWSACVRESSVTRGDSRMIYETDRVYADRTLCSFARHEKSRRNTCTPRLCVYVHLHRTTTVPSYGNACLSIRDLSFPTATAWRKFPLTTRKYILLRTLRFFFSSLLLLFQPLLKNQRSSIIGNIFGTGDKSRRKSIESPLLKG